MSTAIKAAERALTDRDQQDALRIVEATVTIAAIPGLTSAVARDLAVTRIRELSSHHPRQTDVFTAIIQHLESYP